MAKTTLPTDFQDDVLNASMNGKRRYNEVTNDDGTFSLEDVTAYDTVGSDFGASTVNEMNRNINESFDAGKIISDMDALEATSVSGYVPDALLLKEVNNSLGWTLLGTLTSKSATLALPSGASEIKIVASIAASSTINSVACMVADVSALTKTTNFMMGNASCCWTVRCAVDTSGKTMSCTSIMELSSWTSPTWSSVSSFSVTIYYR